MTSFIRPFMVVALSALAISAQAQSPSKPGATPPALAVPPVGPDRTTASFGDWILRCDKRTDVTPPHRFCELGYTVQRPGDAAPQAQVAVGRLSPSDPLRLTVLLPVNVTFPSTPRFSSEGKDGLSLDLAWVRCLPLGCFANVVVADDAARKLKAVKEAARIEFKDGTGRDLVFPISMRGFSEASDAFAKESAN
jgi:invasion protein IalB